MGWYLVRGHRRIRLPIASIIIRTFLETLAGLAERGGPEVLIGPGQPHLFIPQACLARLPHVATLRAVESRIVPARRLRLQRDWFPAAIAV